VSPAGVEAGRSLLALLGVSFNSSTVLLATYTALNASCTGGGGHWSHDGREAIAHPTFGSVTHAYLTEGKHAPLCWVASGMPLHTLTVTITSPGPHKGSASGRLLYTVHPDPNFLTLSTPLVLQYA